MSRLRGYDIPHKALRNAISQVITRAGNTDYSSLEETTLLAEHASEVFAMLHKHADDENEVVLKELNERVPGAANDNMEDHVRIEANQAKLESAIAYIHASVKDGKDMHEDGHKFYQELSAYYSDYLNHMAEEESEIQQLLWDNFNDDELIQHRIKIMARMQPGQLLTWMKYILPALNQRERIGLLSGFKASAPEAFYNQALETARPEMEESVWLKMQEI